MGSFVARRLSRTSILNLTESGADLEAKLRGGREDMNIEHELIYVVYVSIRVRRLIYTHIYIFILLLFVLNRLIIVMF